MKKKRAKSAKRSAPPKPTTKRAHKFGHFIIPRNYKVLGFAESINAYAD